MIQKKISASPTFLSGTNIESLLRMPEGEMEPTGGMAAMRLSCAGPMTSAIPITYGCAYWTWDRGLELKDGKGSEDHPPDSQAGVASCLPGRGASVGPGRKAVEEGCFAFLSLHFGQ